MEEEQILSAEEFASLNTDLNTAAQSTLKAEKEYKAKKINSIKPTSWFNTILNFLLY